MSATVFNPEPTMQLYNKNNVNPSKINTSNDHFLVKDCDGNFNMNNDRTSLDNVFNQETPYKFPALIICNDVKLNNQNKDIYQKYSDIIYDKCENRYNIRNLNSSAGVLQEGYARNIDVDSHLKNINYYTDKCYYDNWKLSPNDDNLKPCHGLKENAKILVPNYNSVGRNYNDCFANCNLKVPCHNSPPTDFNCAVDVKKRYDFDNHKIQGESCIAPADFTTFKKAPAPDVSNSSKFPNEQRTREIMNSINRDAKHDYYQFFENNKCQIFPQQRVFNNVTKRSMLPTTYNLEDIAPKYLA